MIHGRGRLTALVMTKSGRLAVWAYRHATMTLTISIICTGLTVWISSSRLHINADLTSLLPPSFESVQNLEKLKERFGGTGYVVVYARDADVVALKQFADDLAPRLAQLPSVLNVEHRKSTRFLREHALYYLSLDNLKTLHREMIDYYDFKRREFNPFYLNFEDQVDKPKSNALDQGLSDFQISRYRDLLDNGIDDDYYLDAKANVLAVLVKPVKSSSELPFCQQVLSDVQNTVQTLDLKSYGPNFRVEYGGTYTKKVEEQAVVVRDLQRTTLLSLILVLGYLAWHFRRLSAVFLIFIPLNLSMFWTYGLAAITFGTLNILTAFVGSILLGLGIDHGVHWLGRYELEYRRCAQPEKAVEVAFAATAPAIAVSALTTSLAFLGLGLSDFRAFREFGVLSALGNLLMVSAYGILLPALLAIAHKFGFAPQRLLAEQEKRQHYPHRFLALVENHPRALVLGSLLVILAAGALVPRASFDYSFRHLAPESLRSFQLDATTHHLLGHSSTPLLFFTDNVDDERQVVKTLRQRQREKGDLSPLDFAISAVDLFPTDQREKQPWIVAIGSVMRNMRLNKLHHDEKMLYDKIMPMTAAQPFEARDIPKELLARFHSHLDSRYRMSLVFPAFDLSDGRRVLEFARDVSNVPLTNGQHISAVGEPMVMADVLHMVLNEAPSVLISTVVILFVAVWLFFGRIGGTLLCLSPAMVTLLVTVGLLPLVHLKINYINMVMIPLFLGIGVDGAAHLILRDEKADHFGDHLAATGRSIAGALLTTVLGFGALLLSSHQGLRSLGSLALLGLAVNTLACLVALPAFLKYWPNERSRSS